MTKTKTNKIAVSISECASLLSIHPDTVSRWIRIGILPASKPDRRILIRVCDIEQMLDANPVVCP